MKVKVLLVVLALCAVILTGCGGGGGENKPVFDVRLSQKTEWNGSAWLTKQVGAAVTNESNYTASFCIKTESVKDVLIIRLTDKEGRILSSHKQETPGCTPVVRDIQIIIPDSVYTYHGEAISLLSYNSCSIRFNIDPKVE